MWSYLVSKCTISLGAVAFTLVDLFWTHPVAALVFLAAITTIMVVAWLEMLKPAAKPIEPYLGPNGLRLHR